MLNENMLTAKCSGSRDNETQAEAEADSGYSMDASYECARCKRTFQSAEDMNDHDLDCVENPHVCNICDKRFTKNSLLKIHTNVHVGYKAFSCERCAASFNVKYQLNRHMLKHEGKKPFQCKNCDAKFDNNASLKKHNLIHSGLKPFSCKTCDKTFRDSSNLKKHELKHIGVTYPCGICDKQFKLRWSLTVHMQSHNEDKPFACDICDMKFYTRILRDRHSLVHSGFKQFQCKFCDVLFKRKDNLERHFRTVHLNSNADEDVVIINGVNKKHKISSENTEISIPIRNTDKDKLSRRFENDNSNTNAGKDISSLVRKIDKIMTDNEDKINWQNTKISIPNKNMNKDNLGCSLGNDHSNTNADKDIDLSSVVSKVDKLITDKINQESTKISICRTNENKVVTDKINPKNTKISRQRSNEDKVITERIYMENIKKLFPKNNLNLHLDKDNNSTRLSKKKYNHNCRHNAHTNADTDKHLSSPISNKDKVMKNKINPENTLNNTDIDNNLMLINSENLIGNEVSLTKIREENNKRQSVIFIPPTPKTINNDKWTNVDPIEIIDTTGDIEVIPPKATKKTLDVSEMYRKMFPSRHFEPIKPTLAKYIDNDSGYVHKKVNYNIKNSANRWFNYFAETSKSSAESIELYKKILIPSYQNLPPAEISHYSNIDSTNYREEWDRFKRKHRLPPNISLEVPPLAPLSYDKRVVEEPERCESPILNDINARLSLPKLVPEISRDPMPKQNTFMKQNSHPSDIHWRRRMANQADSMYH